MTTLTIESLTKSTTSHIISKNFRFKQIGSINDVTLHSISRGPRAFLSEGIKYFYNILDNWEFVQNTQKVEKFEYFYT